MLKDLVGKEVTVIVSFSFPESSPAALTGKVIDVDDDLIKLDKTNYKNAVGIIYRTSFTGPCIINKNYIIAIFEK